MPVTAPTNQFTDTRSAIISNKVLQAFTASAAPLRAFAVDLSAEAIQRGDKVKVLTIPEQEEAREFKGEYTPGPSSAKGVDVPINRHKFVSWGLTDVEQSAENLIRIEQFGSQNGFQLNKAVSGDIFSVITPENFPEKITVSLDKFNSFTIAELNTKVTEHFWPEGMRSLILSPQLYGQLLKDEGFRLVQTLAGASGLNKDGIIPEYQGFKLYQSALLAHTNPNLVGFAVIPDAMAVAMRYLAPQEGNTYYQAAAVTNESGFTLGFRDYYENSKGLRVQAIEANYGFLPLNKKALIRIELTNAPAPKK